MTEKENKRSLKTTIAGIASAIGIICVSIAAALDGDPETAVNIQTVLGGVGSLLTLVGVSGIGFLAKDGDK